MDSCYNPDKKLNYWSIGVGGEILVSVIHFFF